MSSRYAKRSPEPPRGAATGLAEAAGTMAAVETEGIPASADAAFDPVVRRFHDVYCRTGGRTWANTFWRGTPVLKCPFDLWIYQEILFANRPSVIVETGTYRGGSAYFLASMCDLIDRGRIITIDMQEHEGRPEHPRITYLTGLSTGPEILDAVRAAIEPADTVMAILDSDHARRYVLTEMRAYAPLVSVGQYLIVEDTNINAWQEKFIPGPLEAVNKFMSEDDSFTVDRSREKFFMTFNPAGYLRRVKEAPRAAKVDSPASS
jgi:cephalosporin hydroxylase